MTMKPLAAAILAALVTAASAPALAHHSYAEFDIDSKLTLKGVVKEFQWTNPHSWLLVMVPNAEGKAEQWAVEFSSISLLASRGWKPKTVVPGDRIEITFHPMRNGNHAGSYMAITLPDGRKMGNPNALGTAASQ